MRFLADENIPGDAVTELETAGHDIVWVRTVAPGSKDEDVLALAVREERIILTFDKDFGELAWRTGLPVSTGIVLFRLPMPASTEVGACAHLRHHSQANSVESARAQAGNFARLPEKLSMPSFVPVTRALLFAACQIAQLRARSPKPLEATLWRQAGQIIYALDALDRCKSQERTRLSADDIHLRVR